ncbi:TM1802 family CRISPR-associated protein [Thermus filiformis]|uniref:CRISPR-associated protein n=1 Tax=Thermus filiformis TaxID=276 RepID=A0A0A2WVQ8_THEFI|nr:TM1802 family CRISPR-associated protein [Thermus filiformis]KGQ22882.2 hypothetical protein THFILI_03025 [Thermus filiformis]
MLRELLALGKGLGGGLEDYVQKPPGKKASGKKASGKLYLVDLRPEEKQVQLQPHDLDENICEKYLWVGDPPASNAPRDRATTSKLVYLLGQVPTEMAKDEALRALLAPLLWEPGRAGGKVRYLLDLRGFRLEGAKDAARGPFRIEGGRLLVAPDPWGEEYWEGKKPDAGDLAQRLAELLEEAWGVEAAGKGAKNLFSLALRGEPLARQEAYRRYLLARLLEDRFQNASEGTCHGCGEWGPVVSDSAAFRLKFFIQDKKSFAPGVREEGFRRAYALCRECFAALGAGETFALKRLTLRFLESEALVLPQVDFAAQDLSRLVELVLAEVRGLGRLKAWREFLEQAELAREEVAYLGFSLLFFQRSQAATKVREAAFEVPPSRVEALFGAMEEAGVGGLEDWLFLLPLTRTREGVDAGPALRAVSRLFLGLPFDPQDLLPLWLRTAERAFREDPTLYAPKRGARGALDLVALGADWIRVLRRLGLWGGGMKEIHSGFPLGEEEALFAAYGFGPLEAGLYLLGQAMEAVGQAQARLYEYRKEPLLESIGWQGMSLLRVRHLVAEVMDRAPHYLQGADLTRVLDLLARGTDLLERAQREGLRVSEREVPYYLLMGYAQARARRLRAGKEGQDAA